MPMKQHTEQHFTASDSVRDMVIGMSDGLTVPFALGSRTDRSDQRNRAHRYCWACGDCRRFHRHGAGGLPCYAQ